MHQIWLPFGNLYIEQISQESMTIQQSVRKSFSFSLSKFVFNDLLASHTYMYNITTVPPLWLMEINQIHKEVSLKY